MRKKNACLLLFLLTVCAFVLTSCKDINRIMHNGLDSNTADGPKLIAYDMDSDTYSWDYISSDFQAQTPEEVGAVLYYSKETLPHPYRDGSMITGIKVHIKLVKCGTGEVLIEHTFYPLFPEDPGEITVVEADEADIRSYVDTMWDLFCINEMLAEMTE